MAKKNVSPIMTWAFWSILVLAAFLMVTWEYFVAGFTADASKITWLILGFFAYGLVSSMLVALQLQSEYKSLKLMEAEQRVDDANASYAAAMFDAAMERIRRGDRIEVRNLVTAYGARIKARVDNIGVVSGMLITIGLLGTVVGLIITVTGLGAVLNAGSADFAAMKAGLNKTVSGMGTAFYTTFFGALLGGVVLKVLAAEMKKSASQIVADALRFGELFIAPQFGRKSSEALVDLELRIHGLHGQLAALGKSVAEVVGTLDSKQAALAEGLGGLAETVAKTSEEATARTQAYAAAIEQGIGESSRQADERLKLLASTVAEASDQAGGRIGAMVEAIQQGVVETNRQLVDQAAALLSAEKAALEESARQAERHLAAAAEHIGRSLDESHATANERLGTLVGAIAQATEQTHRLADERLQALVKTIGEASHAAQDKADERLAGFAKRVEESLARAGEAAERRLGGKAAELAARLGEAAGALAALAQSEGADRDA